ncbi:MAG: hypothetical protein ACI955_002058 [Zhongshania sp.]
MLSNYREEKAQRHECQGQLYRQDRRKNDRYQDSAITLFKTIAWGKTAHYLNTYY